MKALSQEARILLRISFAATFAEAMLVPIYAAFTEKVGGSILDAGIAFALYSMATGMAVAVLGTKDWTRSHIKGLLIAGLGLSALCDVSYIFVQDRWQLFGAQLVAGMGTGLIEPTWDALFTENIEHSVLKHWSIWAGGTHFATGVAALAGGAVVHFTSFTALFLAMATIDVIAIYTAWQSLLLPSESERGRPGASVPAAAPDTLEAGVRAEKLAGVGGEALPGAKRTGSPS